MPGSIIYAVLRNSHKLENENKLELDIAFSVFNREKHRNFGSETTRLTARGST